MSDDINKFTFDLRDEYQRKPIAEKIIRLLTSDAKVSPMVIDGGWGTGKTEFCLKLINLIETSDSEFKAVYVDAFSADHADEPLMTLLAAILKLLPEADRPSLIQKALPAVRFGIKTALKAGVSWTLKQDAADVVNDFDKDLQKVGDAAINHVIESLLADHVAAEKSIITLKDALKELAKVSPIVIFIDELDRCRPNFALSMIESIKHVFDVEGVQFVLVTNTDQLRLSIKHCYGITDNAQRYFDKFLGFSFALPQKIISGTSDSNWVSAKHLRSLIKSSDVLGGSGLDETGLIKFAINLVVENDLSLREVETFVRYLEIYHTLVTDGGFPERIIFGYGLLRILGVFISCFKSGQAKELTKGYVDGTFIVGLMGRSGLIDRNEKDPEIEDIITAIIGLESSVNKSAFNPASAEDKEYWGQEIKSLFRSSMSFSLAANKIKIITDVIETLKLNG